MDAIATLSQARTMLANCASIGDAKKIRDQASAVASYLKQQSESFEAQNDAASQSATLERTASSPIRGIDAKTENLSKAHKTTRRLPSSSHSRLGLPIGGGQVADKSTEVERLECDGLIRKPGMEPGATSANRLTLGADGVALTNGVLTMLVLSRDFSEVIVLAKDGVEVATVTNAGALKAKIGIHADGFEIHRKEVWDRIQKERANEAIQIPSE